MFPFRNVVIVSVPPDILDYPTSTDMEVREGSNVTLRCAATGTPKPTVTWRREAGGTITLSNWHEENIHIPSAQIAIMDINHADNNGEVYAIKREIALWSPVLPACARKIDLFVKSFAFAAAFNVGDLLDYDIAHRSVQCSFVTTESGTMTILYLRFPYFIIAEEITWNCHRQNIVQMDMLSVSVASIEGSYLEITDVTRLHMGPYLCIASNGVPPTVSKRIVLIVHFPPMVWIEKQLVGAYEGKVLVLECQSEAYPKPISYWTRPTNETITNDNHYEVETISKGYKGYKMTMRLTIKSVRVQDFGSFRCISTNSLGETESKIKLYRIDRPPTTRRPGTRRDSKKSWKVDHSNEKKAAGMRDEPISKGNYDSGEEQTDFQSATASSSFQRHIFANLGITVFIGIIVSGLST
ncbi:opioid-binding protein/cell adhesion molecule isoform X3 [Vespula maculifrons]|uniref:Opioid-binding protein/cell adhesion molecule isoform X3 n=1 Tax=Vespula maculifrons TaxID=7453 RepID=A0ABD2D179_VESMC